MNLTKIYTDILDHVYIYGRSRLKSNRYNLSDGTSIAGWYNYEELKISKDVVENIYKAHTGTTDVPDTFYEQSIEQGFIRTTDAPKAHPVWFSGGFGCKYPAITLTGAVIRDYRDADKVKDLCFRLKTPKDVVVM